MGYYLRRTQLRFAILDAAPAPGGAWLRAWDSLRLFSPARWSSLPGWPLRGGADEYPGRDEFLEYLTLKHKGTLDTIRETNDFSDDTEHALEGAYNSFLDQFETSEGGSIKAGKEEHEALPEEDVEQEQIVKQKRG